MPSRPKLRQHVQYSGDSKGFVTVGRFFRAFTLVGSPSTLLRYTTCSGARASCLGRKQVLDGPVEKRQPGGYRPRGRSVLLTGAGTPERGGIGDSTGAVKKTGRAQMDDSEW